MYLREAAANGHVDVVRVLVKMARERIKASQLERGKAENTDSENQVHDPTPGHKVELQMQRFLLNTFRGTVETSLCAQPLEFLNVWRVSG